MTDGVIQRVAIRLREHGLRGTARLALDHLEDRAFDLLHGTDTYSIIEQRSLAAIGPNQSQGREYAPTRSRSIRLALKHFRLPADGTFVDLGSGKGKALLVAVRHGFKRVVGVEFAQSLVDIAWANVARLERQLGGATVEIHCMDATEYQFGPDVSTVYMFDPFGPQVMRPVLQNLARSLETHPRTLRIVYMNPVLLALVTELLPVRERSRYGEGFQECVLLSNE